MRFIQRLILSVMFYFCFFAAISWVLVDLGLDWTSLKSLHESFCLGIRDLIANWGPIFIPSAVILYFIKIVQSNIILQVTSNLTPTIEKSVKAAIEQHALSSIEKRISQRVMQGIQIVFTGLSSDNPDDRHYRKAFQMAKRSYWEQFCSQDDHAKKPF